MSSIQGVIEERNRLLSTIGKETLNIMFPKEFELYVMAFEVVDSSNKTLEYFLFPVMPDEFSESIPFINSIKKTLGGVTAISNNTFVPTDITLSGSFGRSFKISLGGVLLDLISSYKSNKLRSFSKLAKTGYGYCKVLQSLINDSKLPDSLGNSKLLIFHNLALGNSYLVKPSNLTFRQSQQNNMIWNYSLSLKTIAPLESLNKKGQIKKKNLLLVMSGFIQKRTTNLISNLNSLL